MKDNTFVLVKKYNDSKNVKSVIMLGKALSAEIVHIGGKCNIRIFLAGSLKIK